MKRSKSLYILLLVLFLPLFLFSQKKRCWEGDISLSGAVMKHQNSVFGGFALNFEAPIFKKCFTGAGVSVLFGSANNSYGYSTTRPELSYIDLNWINEYRFFNTPKLKINLCLVNSLAMLELGDGNNRIKTNSGSHSSYLSKPLADNLYYSFQPGINISLALPKVDYLFVKVNYNVMYSLYSEFSSPNIQMLTLNLGIRGEL